LQLREEVARRMGQRADLADADLKLHVNEAYLEMCTTLDFVFLEASVAWTCEANQSAYGLPAGVREVISVQSLGSTEVDNAGTLEKVDMEEFRRRGIDSLEFSGKPTTYTLTPDGALVLWPQPDEAYVMSLEAKVRPARLVNDTDYPVLPDEWIEPLTVLSISKAAGALNEFEMASQRYNEYLGSVRARRNERAERKVGTKGGVWIPRSRDELRRTSRGGYV